MSTPAPTCRRANIAEAIRVVLTDLSGIPAEELIGDASYLDLGFDSLLLTQVSKALANKFGINLTLRDLMGNLDTIDALVVHLDATLPSNKYRPSMVAAPVTPAAPVTISPAGPVNSVPGLSAAHAPVVVHAPMAPVNASRFEGLVAQQLDLMRQQLSLLRGGTILPQAAALASAPSAALISAPTPAAAPVSAAPVKPAEAPASSSNVSAPTTSINRSLDDTLTGRQQRHLDELVAKYVAKTRTSKELTAKYRQWYADPRTVSGFNRRWKEMIYQIAVRKSKVSRLVDVDGNEYIDLLNGFGPNFLGHSPDFVTEALKEQLDRGVEVGPQNVTAMEAAQLFCEITGNERASFVNTGSEAVQAAMRLARTVTGREKIVIFAKDYHGNFDEVLVKGVGSGDAIRSLPIAPGIPRRAVDDMIVLPYGTDEALEIIRARAHEVAAVIVEPIQSRRPEFQPREFIREVREITRHSGSVFVFDEVITGFRTGPRGAQEYYDVEADIATYGKVVGGGMPLGVVAGKAEYMDTFDGGMWQYGDDSFPEKGVTFFAGTFVRHPLAMAAVKEVLLHLKGKGPEFWQGVKDRATRLATTVDRMFVENNAPFRMPNFGSQMFIRAAEDHKYANLLFFHLRNKGVFLLEGFPTYMTAAHTDADIDYCISAFRESVAELQDGGFFDVPSGITVPHLNGSRLSGPPKILTAGISASKPTGTTDDGEVTKNETDRHPSRHPMTEPLAEVWLASQISENASLCFNEINVLNLHGRINVEALLGSLQDLVDRHDALRAVYPADGDGFTIQPRMVADLTLLDGSAETVEEAIDRERRTPFDLENGPLFRAVLVKTGDAEQVLILNAHHLACDGWSYNVLLKELGDSYTARCACKTPELEPAASFGAYARDVAAKSGNDDEAYWIEQFSEPALPLQWPLDFPKPQEADYRCATVAEHLDPDAVRGLKRAAGRSGATLFGLLMGAYQVLLHRICRQDRFVVAFPAAAQNSEGNEGLVGHCVNFLPFVAQIDPALPFGDFLRATQSRLLDALDHQDFTYGRLIKKVGGSERPRIEAVFNYERMEETLGIPGIRSDVREVERAFATNPLFLKTCEGASGLEIRFDFHSSLFSADTAKEWLETYGAMLKAIAANPAAPVSQIAASLSEGQWERLRAWNRTTTAYPRGKTVPELFDESASRRGSATAIRFCGRNTSYNDLSGQVDRLAQTLIESGVAPGDRVGLFLERSPEMVAGMLAILKCGAAYVPLDPQFPVERVRFMIEDSGVRVILSEKSLFDRLPKEITTICASQALKRGRSGQAVVSRVESPESAACLLYTSGSTGKPKGTLITHRGIIRLVRNTDYTRFDDDQVFLQAATICFDPQFYDTFGALLNGASVVLPPPGPLSIDVLAKAVREDGVTQLFLTTGLFQVMVDEQLDAFSGLQAVMTGGDIASPAHMAKFLAAHPSVRLLHPYGPTEGTTYTTCHEVRPEDTRLNHVPIGRPIANTTVWILDASGRPVPPGVPGELYTGGDGVALGYFGRPELTAERFVPDPFSDQPGARLYRTGDVCRYRPDGLIEFLARVDHQVKIRGFRIEPGEVESQLGRHPGVRQCKVVVRGDNATNKFLAAYVAPVTHAAPSRADLEDYLRSKLPAYMVPAAFVLLDELPMNANGKVDTHALPVPERVSVASEAVVDDRPPTETETKLAGLWKDLLGVASVGLDDDFFALGGHSLLGMKLFSRIQRTFDLSLPLGKLFRAPTVRQLAHVIDAELGTKAPGLIATPAPTAEPAPSDAPAPRQRGGYRVIDDEPETASTPALNEPVASTVVPLQTKGAGNPLFAVHGGDGGILFYGKLSERLGEDRPFYAFEAPALTAGGPIPDDSVEETAAQYVRELLKVQPSGPVHLCGYSFGGVVAYEMARQIMDMGRDIGFLGLIDTENPAVEARRLSLSERVAANWNDRSREKAGVLEKMGALGRRVGSGLAYRLYFGAEDALARTLPKAKHAGWLRQVQLRKAHERAMESYSPGPFGGRLTLFRATMGGDKFEIGYDYGWESLALAGLDIVDVPGNHISLFHDENIEAVSAAFREALQAAVDTPA